MNVSLTRKLEALVQAKVKSGRYSSASEVVREGLRLLEERDRVDAARFADLKQKIQIGIDQLDRGEGILLDTKGLRKFINQVKRDGRRTLAAERRKRVSA